MIASGPLAGTRFSAFIKDNPAALGSRCPAGDFPVMVKLIDAAQNLSVQVHPDDAYGMRVEGERGKTEMWYILDCEPGAFLYFGFEREISADEARRRIADNTITEVLHKAPVHRGMCSLSPPGPSTPLGRVSCWRRFRRIQTQPTVFMTSAVSERTESPARCTSIKRCRWRALRQPDRTPPGAAPPASGRWPVRCAACWLRLLYRGYAQACRTLFARAGQRVVRIRPVSGRPGVALLWGQDAYAQ